jgi:2-polyprenyl-3-methyl-5-hydroxy-6-metoxy-1,4-benzoquinol methylase
MRPSPICPACGGERFAARRVLPELTTQTCVRCRLILARIERVGEPVPEFDLVDEAGYLRSIGEVRRRQATEMLKLIRPYARPGASVLDVGCSFGFFLLEARRAGFQVHGIEPDARAYERARSALGDGTVQLGSFSRDTATGAVDVLCTLDVIEHIPPGEHAEFARLVTSALAAGGVWVIKVPTTEGLYYRSSDLLLRLRAGSTIVRRLWQTRYEYPHLLYFDRRNLTAWLSRHGFDVVAHRYLQEVPNTTAIDRLTTDGDIGRASARLLVPVVGAVNLVESIRGRSDSLVVVARPRS